MIETGFLSSKILFAHRWRLISDRLENIARSPEASNKYPVRKLFRIISVFDIVFLSRIAYTINAQKARKRGGVTVKESRGQPINGAL